MRRGRAPSAGRTGRHRQVNSRHAHLILRAWRMLRAVARIRSKRSCCRISVPAT
ncbi:hypothetical protein SJA_C2-02210 [Sphingobium indicum UT26S]|uniref:Transposase n=1 Tax=Sphingobium indicum (strain DSM 16413 / CCM 7287 / MTCC 6362 / UT26 / NBRC 101211 / UT26S) TaxID=452662 RepID=D4Z7W5_SPHIU|nr:hypothetical protein SJA_C2-02210 [Sphingobium indicum UT26S]